MKMPSSIVNKVEVKPSTESLGDAAKQCLMCLEKKVRNLEKRKSKIEINREKQTKGTKLEKEQELSLSQYEQVTHDLEFARELHKQFISINQEHEKMVKKQAKRDKMERATAEIKRVGEILHLQSTLDLLGGSEVREDFKTGKHGAVVLTDDNLEQLDKLYQAISPSRDDSGEQYPERLNTAADHLVNILEGKDRSVLGTTYKELKELLSLINHCGYFENASRASQQEALDAAEPVEPEQEEEQVEEEEVKPGQADVGNGESVDVPAESSQPIDLTMGAGDGGITMGAGDGPINQMPDIVPAPQPNTREQDAFFAPSSTQAYQESPDVQYGSPVYGQAPQMTQQVPDFESFTNNRPFQFIQTSYVMPEDAATAPSVVDPAVIHAQPAQPSTLSFMSQGGFDASGAPQPSHPQPNSQPAPPSQPLPAQQTMTPPSQPTQPSQPSQPDFNNQGYSQPTLQQNMQQPDGRFTSGTNNMEDVNLPPHGGMMAPSPYEIPPSIPMPPSQSQQDQSQLEQQQQDEKKFQMNAAAPVFNPTMYAQQVTGGQSSSPAAPPPDVQGSQPSPDFNNAGVNTGQANDFQQGYQGNGFNNGYRGRGNFRGGRGAPANGSSRAPATNQMQNGFQNNNRGGNTSQNSRGGGRGGSTFQGYPPSNNYRPDSYQGNNNYSNGGFKQYAGRGGMSGSSGPGSNTYQRGGPGGSAGRGGMRGMARGGTSGGPRGGASRGGYTRPPPQ